MVLGLTTYIFSKYAMDEERGLGPMSFACAWTGAAAVYALALIAVTGRLREVRLPRGTRRTVLLSGLFCGMAHIPFWHAVELLNPAFVSFLARFIPAVMILASIVFFRERLTRWEVVAAAAMLAGGAVTTIGGEWRIVGRGMLLMGITAVFGTTWRMLAKRTTSHTLPIVANMYRCAVSAVVVATWGLAVGRLQFDADAARWAALLVGALLGPCLGVSLMYLSFRHWPLSRTAMVMMAQPLIVLPASILVRKRPLTAFQFIGGLIILAGGMWLIWLHGRVLESRGAGGRERA
jgi:drug/metabolite transporter (DMT)-like permease